MRELNLPELPEGQFWRVTTHPLLGDIPWVELRRKRWWGSELIRAKWYSGEYKFDSYADEVEAMAERIIQDRDEEFRLRAEARNYAGDYT